MALEDRLNAATFDAMNEVQAKFGADDETMLNAVLEQMVVRILAGAVDEEDAVRLGEIVAGRLCLRLMSHNMAVLNACAATFDKYRVRH